MDTGAVEPVGGLAYSLSMRLAFVADIELVVWGMRLKAGEYTDVVVHGGQ